ncbi:spliceosome RNA helicase DDX39B-like [Paramacrobiotus metropolitanus]|uniref:spliceosome RNA helicase DDX39B-like n=1 Tax=Paramacrobiotus metropolitanus TaxID=2943436 RepID=UPI002445F717|nr:spliceosome RNA helicase DDX39B-like [Paramacrobiotus metropolitanus]XP_055334084.1 spliceosome RNA helicase DDX39B-like [Paramacrobiotus metropolitanus]
MALMQASEEILDYEDADDVVVPNGKHDHNLDDHALDYMQEDYVGEASVHTAEFKDLMLKPELLRAIQDAGFKHPSEVQANCIPKAVLGMDLVCQAKSGFGKTAVFVISTLQELDPSDPNQPSVIVLLPTRELAFQTAAQFKRFKKYLPSITLSLFFGGIAYEKDITNIRNRPDLNVIIGTPGRLAALVRDKILKLDHVKHFIIDECDKMLHQEDMRAQIKVIFDATPAKKQVMLFSATLSKKIMPICEEFVQDPYRHLVDDCAKLTLKHIVQYYVKITEAGKLEWLIHILDTLEYNQIIIFVNTVDRAQMLGTHLFENNYPSVMIHSGMEQIERLARYQQFKSFSSRIMVATDLFGRGMDIERVNIVINYDCPFNSDQYLHRIGRGGRFNRKGLAVTLVSDENDCKNLSAVQDRFDIDIAPIPDELDETLWAN